MALLPLTFLTACRGQTATRRDNNRAGVVEAVKPVASAAPVVAAVATPVSMPGALVLTHQYFQSRGVVTIVLKPDDVGPGDVISLVNSTTGQSLINQQQLSLSDISADASYDITIRLYPSAPLSVGRFAYGENQLRLSVNDTLRPGFAQESLYLNDFPYFALATTAFKESSQSSGGFEGSVDYVMGSIVTAGDETMTTGLISTLSR